MSPILRRGRVQYQIRLQRLTHHPPMPRDGANAIRSCTTTWLTGVLLNTPRLGCVQRIRDHIAAPFLEGYAAPSLELSLD